MRPRVVGGTPVMLKRWMAPASGKLDPSCVKTVGYDEADEIFGVSA